MSCREMESDIFQRAGHRPDAAISEWLWGRRYWGRGRSSWQSMSTLVPEAVAQLEFCPVTSHQSQTTIMTNQRIPERFAVRLTVSHRDKNRRKFSHSEPEFATRYFRRANRDKQTTGRVSAALGPWDRGLPFTIGWWVASPSSAPIKKGLQKQFWKPFDV